MFPNAALKLIGKLNKNDKLVTRGGYVTIVQQNTYMSWLYRKFYGETRRDALIFVSNVIRDVMALPMTENLEKDLRQALIGLDNLKDTYEGDKAFEAEIEAIQETINMKLLQCV